MLEQLSSAIFRATKSVTKARPIGLGFATQGSDFALVREATDVEVVDSALFRAFIEEVSALPAFAILSNDCLAFGLGGYSGPITVEAAAKFMLAQTLQGRSHLDVAREMLGLLVANSSDVQLILAVRGLTVTKKIELAETVDLLPLSSLTPSFARGAAMGQDSFGGGSSEPASAAFVTTLRVQPVLASTSDARSAAVGPRNLAHFRSAWELLRETCRCFALISDIVPAPHINWIEFAHPAARFLTRAGWGYPGSSRTMVLNAPVKDEAAVSFFKNYFAIREEVRARVLRIPIDRLARAMVAHDITDQAIDLGIALEALLLHDVEGSELSYRMSLRGALLQGGDINARRAARKLLKRIYDLRSKAVHRGRLENGNAETREVLEQGKKACSALIHQVIGRGGSIDFDTLELSHSERSA